MLGMSVDDLRMAVCRLAGPRGGIDLLKSLLCNDSNDHPTEPTPEWCICGRCRQMDSLLRMYAVETESASLHMITFICCVSIIQC